MSSHSFQNEYFIPIDMKVLDDEIGVQVIIETPSSICEWHLTRMEAEYLAQCLNAYFNHNSPSQ